MGELLWKSYSYVYKNYKPRFKISGGVFDVAGKERSAEKLEKRTSTPDFWNNPERAQAEMQELSDLRSEITLWSDLGQRGADAITLLEMAIEEQDEDLIAEVGDEAAALENELGKLEFSLCLSGPYDRADAILAIHAGAGGTDTQD